VLDQRELTAIHEAAHAVAALAVGCTLSPVAVSIMRTGRRRGWVTPAAFREGASVAESAAVSLAGYEAEAAAGHRRPGYGPATLDLARLGTDGRLVLAEADHVGGNWWIGPAWQYTRELVAWAMPAILDLAAIVAKDERGWLTAETVAAWWQQWAPAEEAAS
jgi:hypothetical protein